jgi:outer membrane lipoprotein SlyB
MGFRFGLIAGAAAGYVLGTRAGRERYEQIAAAARSFAGSETARTLEGGVREAWGTAQQEFPALRSVDEAIDRLSDRG